MANPLSWIFHAVSNEKSCLVSIPFLATYIDVRTVNFFPAESWLVNLNFPHASRMQGCRGNKFCCSEIKIFLLPGHKFCARNICFPVKPRWNQCWLVSSAARSVKIVSWERRAYWQQLKWLTAKKLRLVTLKKKEREEKGIEKMKKTLYEERSCLWEVGHTDYMFERWGVFSRQFCYDACIRPSLRSSSQPITIWAFLSDSFFFVVQTSY